MLWQGALACNGQQGTTLCALGTTLDQQVLPSLAHRSQKHSHVGVSVSSHLCLFAGCLQVQSAGSTCQNCHRLRDVVLYSPHVPHQRCTRQTALDRQDLSRTYLAHHELESDVLIITIITPLGRYACNLTATLSHGAALESAVHVAMKEILDHPHSKFDIIWSNQASQGCRCTHSQCGEGIELPA